MQIRLLNKTLLTTYNHYYYMLSFDRLRPVNENRLECFEISDNNLDLIHLSGALKKMLHEQPDCVKGYGFKDFDGNVIGHVFLMKRGGREVLYKIETIDAYLFAVRVFDEFRGRSYAGEMITHLVNKLREEGVESLYLTVKKNNASAIRVYEKLGFDLIGSKFFIRVWKYNVPYISL